MRGDTTQISLRIPNALIEAADAHAKRLAPLVQTRAEVLRAAVELGLEAMKKAKGPRQ